MSWAPHSSHVSDMRCTIGQTTGCDCLLCTMDGLDFVIVDPPLPPFPDIVGCQSEGWVSAIPIIEYLLDDLQGGKFYADLIPRPLRIRAIVCFSGIEFPAIRIHELDQVFASILPKDKVATSEGRLARARECLADWLLGPDRGDLVKRSKRQLDYEAAKRQSETNDPLFVARRREKDARYRANKRLKKQQAQQQQS